jgi:hypothetical protein
MLGMLLGCIHEDQTNIMLVLFLLLLQSRGRAADSGSSRRNTENYIAYPNIEAHC